MATTVMTKVLGGQVLAGRADLRRRPRHDVRRVPRAGRQDLRAAARTPATAFVVVAAPERDALREASYFVDRLDEEGMPLAGVVVNRIQRLAAPSLSGSRALAAAEQLADVGDGRRRRHRMTEGLLRLHADLAEAAARQEALARRFTAGHPGIPVVEVPAARTGHPRPRGAAQVGRALTAG